MAFLQYSLDGHTLSEEPCFGIHEIYNFGRSCLGHYKNILSFSDLCQGVEKKKCYSTKTSALGSWKFTTVIDFVIISIYIQFSELFSRVEE